MFSIKHTLFFLFHFIFPLIFLHSVFFLVDKIVDGKVHHDEQYNINDYHHGL